MWLVHYSEGLDLWLLIVHEANGVPIICHVNTEQSRRSRKDRKKERKNERPRSKSLKETEAMSASWIFGSTQDGKSTLSRRRGVKVFAG